MSGKGDNRRPTNQKSFERNHDALDWNNDKAPTPPQKRWEWDAEKGEWNEAQEAPADGTDNVE